MQSTISFVFNNKIETLNFGDTLTPTTTVLNYLRKNPNYKGVKEGCAEGDCGACTVVIAELTEENKLHYKAIDSCLVFLPMLQGKQLITVENLVSKNGNQPVLHPVQQAMVDTNGSQCGFCTPGIVMSMLAMYKNKNSPSKEYVEDALTGNLCRCTGYKPIIEAAIKSCTHNGKDIFTENEITIVELLQQLKANSTSAAIKTDEQQYFQPLTINEALELKQQYPEAVVINGATDVALRVTKKHELLPQLLDLSNIKELKTINTTSKELILGAGTSLENVKNIAEKELPALYDTLKVFGSKQIRELATLGGNIGSSSPISDTLPLLLVYDAEIKLQDAQQSRTLKVKDYIIAYRKTARTPIELITSISIPKPIITAKIKFYKVSKRKDLDISTASAAFAVQLKENVVEEIRIAYGGMAEIAKRVTKAETFLTGKQWNRETIEQAMQIIGTEFTPISDARSGSEFRASVAKNLLLKFWSETYTE